MIRMLRGVLIGIAAAVFAAALAIVFLWLLTSCGRGPGPCKPSAVNDGGKGDGQRKDCEPKRQ